MYSFRSLGVFFLGNSPLFSRSLEFLLKAADADADVDKAKAYSAPHPHLPFLYCPLSVRRISPPSSREPFAPTRALCIVSPPLSVTVLAWARVRL
jgi:hypothetical protein